ncbi:YwiC-like family protein [Paenibacillus enshidis]|uniref:YwiC-like family protein n=1 Tax=Paenibacillus enshidis TaxID=1458439 RepID=A0ABV5ANM3_9BACL
MNRYIPNQHGAWVMLILPFLTGLAFSGPHGIHIPLFVCWLVLYLFTFPALQWIKTGKGERYCKPTVLYGAISLPLLIFLIWHEPRIIWYGVLLLPFFALNMYYAKIKKERALLNDFAAILLFCSFIYPVVYLGGGTEWRTVNELFVLLVLYFAGTALYVKTVLREKNNSRYYYASVVYHLVIMLAAASIKPLLFIPFLILLLRAILLPGQGLKAKPTGIAEMVFAAVLYGSFLILFV